MAETGDKVAVPEETSSKVPEAAPTAAEPSAVEAEKLTPDTKPTKSPLETLRAELENIKSTASHSEMWGVELTDGHVPTDIVLEKFLRANDKNVEKAKAQLIQALKWRKELQPDKLLAETEFDEVKFGGLGYVTIYPKSDTHGREIVSWNIYGSVKNLKNTFEDVDEFIKWRAAVMELSVQQLDIKSATQPIAPDGEDPYKMVQVHDYMNVSFLRQDPAVKAATKKTIEVFAMAYPELLKEKFFVNVPLLMGWVFAAIKLFISPATVKKFHPLSYGGSLAGELGGLGPDLPSAYGGKGQDIKEGLTVKYAATPIAPTEEVKTDAPSGDAPAETIA